MFQFKSILLGSSWVPKKLGEPIDSVCWWESYFKSEKQLISEQQNCSYQQKWQRGKLSGTHWIGGDMSKVKFSTDSTEKQQTHSHVTVCWSTRDSVELPASWLPNSTAYGNGKKNGFSWHWANELMRQCEHQDKCIKHTKLGKRVPTPHLAWNTLVRVRQAGRQAIKLYSMFHTLEFTQAKPLEGF